MKIIDLLNKIANGEKIKKFKYKNRVFYSLDNDYWCDEIGGWFSVEVLDISILNDEIEIIEEKKEIEKLPPYIKGNDLEFEVAMNRKTINELIDVINDMRDKE